MYLLATGVKHGDALVMQSCQKNFRVRSNETFSNSDSISFPPAFSITPYDLKTVFNLKGYDRRVAWRRGFLTEERQKIRLAWSLDYLQWGVPDWNKVTLSDECTFNIGGRYEPM